MSELKMEAIKKLPEYIMVGGSRYRLALEDAAWRDREGTDGKVEFETMTIHVCITRSPSEFLNTLLHELSHVIWREWNLPQRPKEERCVTAFGYGWTAIYQQNPGILEAVYVLRSSNDHGED